MKELSIFVFSEMKKCEKYFGKSQQKITSNLIIFCKVNLNVEVKILNSEYRLKLVLDWQFNFPNGPGPSLLFLICLIAGETL